MNFKDKKKSRYKIRILFCFLIVLIVIGGYFFVFQKIYASTIYPRVYCCGNLNLGGLKLEKAEIFLRIFTEKAEEDGFSFRVQTDLGKKRVAINPNLIALSDPDLSRSLVRFNIAATLEAAFQVGRKGDFFQRASEMALALIKDKKIELIIDIDNAEIGRALKENFKELERPAENARLAALNNELILIEAKPGFALDYQKALEQLRENLIVFKNEEIQIPVIRQDSSAKVQNFSLIFDQAKEIFDFAPYFLVNQNKKWEVEPSQIVQWFEIKTHSNSLKQNSNESEQSGLDFNREKILAYLQSIAEEINIKPLQRRLTMDNDRVVEFQNGQSGMILNPEGSVENIVQGILNKTKEIKLIVEKVDPDPLPGDIAGLGIKELIGQGISNFAGSPKNRRHNIKVGAEKLHGILIKPDEEFSLIKALGEVNEENGFLPELVIKGDRTIPEYGGGLCQIATTAFRVAFNAGLPITERQPHSYRVVYYEPAGTDATIYNPHPDLRFINDTGYHLLWQTEVAGDELIFRFYGTSDGRKVTATKTKIFNVINPGPAKFIETDQLAPGEKKKVESAHSGADAEFRNIITFTNGVVREEIWQSRYHPWPEVWLIGKEAEETDSESPEE